MGVESLAPELASFLEPGVTPEKTRALVNKIWQVTHEETDREIMLVNLSFLAGVACSYLLDYATGPQPKSTLLGEGTPAEQSEKPDYTTVSSLARSLYNDYINNHPTIHTNRFPSWQELTPEGRGEWLTKARKAGRNGAE